MARFGSADVTVVIPTRDRWDILARTLEALARQTVQGFETLVVVDGTDQRPPDLGSRARVVVQEHAGPGAARNRGASAAQTALLLFLGDDMIPRDELLSRHLAVHNERPADEVAVLGHVVWHPEVAQTSVLRWMEWSSSQFDFATIDGSQASWAHFYSCNVSLKRSFFLGADGFDEDFTFDYEDLDCGYRLGQHGLQLVYEPGAVAEHLHSYDWERLQRRYESRARAEQLMMAKHEWFAPFFRRRITRAAARPPLSPVWARVADRIPRGGGRAGRLVRSRADVWYHQQLAPRFDAAWEAERARRADEADHGR